MKKPLIITIGTILILIILSIWGYLLFFGTPDNSNDVFSNLGFGGGVIETEENPEVDLGNITAQIETGTTPLQQLTTKPVAGFGFVGSSSDIIRYVEKGTGHIFQIDLTDGTEILTSGKTIPKVVEVVFDDSGNSVAFTIEDGRTRSIIAGAINVQEENIDFINLPENSFDPEFVSETLLRFAITTPTGSEGHELNITKTNRTKLFSVPFRDITVLWGDKTHVYNRPAPNLKGSLYSIGKSLAAQTPGEYGFAGGITDTHYLGSYIDDSGQLKSYAIDMGTDERIHLPITYTPEKCASARLDSSTLWCSSIVNSLGGDFIKDWYQGTIRMEDWLWQVDINSGEANLYSNFLEDSGRLIDVDKMETDAEGLVPAFRNKVDNTLWIYDTRI